MNINEQCRTCEWAVKHVWISCVTHAQVRQATLVTTHVTESCRVHRVTSRVDAAPRSFWPSCVLLMSTCNTSTYTLQHAAKLQHTTTKYNILQHTTTHCNTLQHTATHCNTLQHTATHCNTLQHTATHCNTLHMCYLHMCPWHMSRQINESCHNSYLYALCSTYHTCMGYAAHHTCMSYAYACMSYAAHQIHSCMYKFFCTYDFLASHTCRLSCACVCVPRVCFVCVCVYYAVDDSNWLEMAYNTEEAPAQDLPEEVAHYNYS